MIEIAFCRKGFAWLRDDRKKSFCRNFSSQIEVDVERRKLLNTEN